jgi:hypothetical protein
MRALKVPVEEIRFAAKTGFITKGLWDDFFAKGSYSWRRRQWNSLTERGYFRPHPSPIVTNTLVLHRKNLEVKALLGDSISSAPYVSQLNHDQILARSILTLARQNLIESFRTELELKRENIGSQKVFNLSEKTKHPDAIIEIRGPEKIHHVSLELELTKKDYKRYFQIIRTYSANSKVQRILFIARTEGVFNCLRKAMRENSYQNALKPVGFISYHEWVKDPANAPIHTSGKITSLTAIKADLQKNESANLEKISDGNS